MSQMLDASQVQLVYAKCIPGSLTRSRYESFDDRYDAEERQNEDKTITYIWDHHLTAILLCLFSPDSRGHLTQRGVDKQMETVELIEVELFLPLELVQNGVAGQGEL